MPSDKLDLARVTLAILAGGEASRMGYPKGELRLGGRPILEVLIARLAWRGPTLLVTAPGREHPPGWELFSSELVDPSSGQGPLRGVLTALEGATTPLIIVSAVDMPLIQSDQLTWLATVLTAREGALGIMFRQRNGAAERVQPFPLALRAEATPVVRQFLESRQRSLHGLLDDPRFEAVDTLAEWGDDLWTNLNTPADVDSLGA